MIQPALLADVIAGRRRIYLMRHGDVSYFGGDGSVRDARTVRLTDRGRARASAAGQALTGLVFDRVITSGLTRTVDTARLVLAELGTPAPEIEEWPDLEELRAGDPDAIADADLDTAVLEAFSGVAPVGASYLYGELVSDLVERVNAGIDRLLHDKDWTTALLVLHGGVNRAILSRALTGRTEFLGHLEQSPACVNVLDHGPDWYVRAVNVTPYEVVPVGDRSTTMEEMAEQYRARRVTNPPVAGPGGHGEVRS